ncbi:hypothetical protein F0562_027243 [Nyssa sinensis]|uniref:Uncharacterized protein n=1 Tax=Nyssa sinensis TaxID=561372 RepID=A0A5J5B2V8_9ASTE|nr:hypothetical protein F0562_027243 [Nyssa sinensis]
MGIDFMNSVQESPGADADGVRGAVASCCCILLHSLPSLNHQDDVGLLKVFEVLDDVCWFHLHIMRECFLDVVQGGAFEILPLLLGCFYLGTNFLIVILKCRLKQNRHLSSEIVVNVFKSTWKRGSPNLSSKNGHPAYLLHYQSLGVLCPPAIG